MMLTNAEIHGGCWRKVAERALIYTPSSFFFFFLTASLHHCSFISCHNRAYELTVYANQRASQLNRQQSYTRGSSPTLTRQPVSIRASNGASSPLTHKPASEPASKPVSVRASNRAYEPANVQASLRPITIMPVDSTTSKKCSKCEATWPLSYFCKLGSSQPSLKTCSRCRFKVDLLLTLPYLKNLTTIATPS
jgi:hypothetical protein